VQQRIDEKSSRSNKTNLIKKMKNLTPEKIAEIERILDGQAV